jgi:hypothetical protein
VSEQQTDTNRLRAIWSQSAGNIVERLREGGSVSADEVSNLQKSLEGIEGREELEKINKIAMDK